MLDPASIPAHLRANEHHDALHARGSHRRCFACLFRSPRSKVSSMAGCCRYSPGKAKRARSINSIGAGVLPFAEKLSHCHRLLPAPSSAVLVSHHAVFATGQSGRGVGRGRFRRTSGHARDVRCACRRSSEARRRATAQSVNAEQFAAVFCELHGLDAAKADAERERYARAAGRSVFVVQCDGDAPIACGSLAIEGKLAGIFGMVTAAEHRGRGIASAIVAQAVARRACRRRRDGLSAGRSRQHCGASGIFEVRIRGLLCVLVSRSTGSEDNL